MHARIIVSVYRQENDKGRMIKQGVHSTGKPGKVKEFGQTGKNLKKSGNFEKKVVTEFLEKNFPSFFFLS